MTSIDTFDVKEKVIESLVKKLQIRKERERKLKYDDPEHDEETDPDDDGEGEEIRVDVEGLVVGQDDADARVLLEREQLGD